MKFLTTVTGSYPRKDVQKDTLRKSSVSDEDALEMIKWAVKEQSNLGLDIITDGEGYRENMYWFYQLRTEGVDAENKKYKHFSTGGSMEKVDLSKTHGTKGFGIECAVIKDEIKNLDTKLATKWKMARKNTPEHIQVKQTITGPHMLARFSVNERTDLYPDDQALAMAYADVIIEELKKGANFENLAKNLSDDEASRKNGGDLDFIYKGIFETSFDEAVEKLNPGETSGKIKTRFGFHVIKLIEKRPSEMAPFTEMKPEIQKYLYIKEAKKKVSSFIEKLKQTADIQTFF